ncbi:MAG: hypothetical protein CVV47_12545 [Spirochaetae bacterium HGW-Spirochaetae-3]|jgi:succinate dehydrogenase / fumarate reductase iron-sulfur subunit|nr:MAG: hypothetical protein CVV47_12545 [Spirochaetae bacterium HGW-Spirochaetae-3]
MSGDRIPLTLRVRNGAAVAEFRIDAEPRRTVLDMLERLRSGGGTVPAYRHSCHHGSCGTCGARINGVEALMCLTSASDLGSPRARVPGGPAVEPERGEDGSVIVELEPLAKMTVISGIAVYPGTAFAGIPAGAGYLAVSEPGGRAPLPPDPTEPRPAGRVRFEACIECGSCVSSCPVAVPFIGPAALAAVNREREKRPERAPAMLALAAASDGVEPCGRHLACSRVCPQAVYPGKHIQLLRNALAEEPSASG